MGTSVLWLNLLALSCSRYIKPRLPRHPAQQILSPHRAHHRPTRPTRPAALPSLLLRRRRRRHQNIQQPERRQHVQSTDLPLLLRVAAVLHRRQWHNSQAYRLWRRFPMDTGATDDSAILIHDTNQLCDNLWGISITVSFLHCIVLLFCLILWS